MKRWLVCDGGSHCLMPGNRVIRAQVRRCLAGAFSAALLSSLPVDATASETCGDPGANAGVERIVVVKIMRSPVAVVSNLLGLKVSCPQDLLIGRIAAADRERSLVLARNPYVGPAAVQTYIYRN